MKLIAAVLAALLAIAAGHPVSKEDKFDQLVQKLEAYATGGTNRLDIAHLDEVKDACRLADGWIIWDYITPAAVIFDNICHLDWSFPETASVVANTKLEPTIQQLADKYAFIRPYLVELKLGSAATYAQVGPIEKLIELLKDDNSPNPDCDLIEMASRYLEKLIELRDEILYTKDGLSDRDKRELELNLNFTQRKEVKVLELVLRHLGSDCSSDPKVASTIGRHFRRAMKKLAWKTTTTSSENYKLAQQAAG